ncbi:Eco57I restriction-modification methylase domain-containing protein [Corynebacterium amycolatum]|uniref:Eco57I restriction-modification methylase domain-containing protein n=1 Tax=Corynebacterium amycolatum TaxID=43765 RepID=UPI0037583BC1
MGESTRVGKYGEVYTKQWVVEAMLDQVGYTSNRNLAELQIVEPSIGAGSFLVEIVKRLLKSAQKFRIPLNQLGSCIYGIDLQKERVEETSDYIVKLLLEAGATKETANDLAKQWICEGDYLLGNIPTDVDIVIGNPPYIRAEDIDRELETVYRSRWKTMQGRSDIYIGFFERSLRIIKPGGRLAFICADRWMKNAYGRRLRNLIVSDYSVESLWQLHDVDAFESKVSAYPAIIVISKSDQGEVTIIETKRFFDHRSIPEVDRFIQGIENEGKGDQWNGIRLPKWFENDDFWPSANPRIIGLLERLQNQYNTLEHDGKTRIGIGVATGADKEYIVSSKDCIDVEDDRLLPLVVSDDIRSGILRSEGKWLLNPWDENGELINLDEYPKLKNILSSSQVIKNRYVAKKYPNKWYRTIDRIDPKICEEPKLLFQDMKAQITPVLEPGGLYPHHNLYYIVSESWDLEVLGGLLMSTIAELFISSYGVKMRGGTLRFQAQYLRKIAVPSPDEMSDDTADALKEAFRTRNREAADRAAEKAYGLPEGTIHSIV